MTIGRIRALTGAVIGAVSLVTCGYGDGGTGPVEAIDFALSSQTLSLERNASAAIDVTLSAASTRTLEITVTGAPAGVTVTATPSSIVPGLTSSTLTVVAGPTAAVGAATLTVHATAPGLSERTETLALTVTDAPAGDTTWDFCRPADVPIWFAVQDGDGEWTRVTANATTFSFDVPSGRGGVAFVRTEDFDPADTTTVPFFGQAPATGPASRWALQRQVLMLRAPGTAASVEDPGSALRHELVVVYGAQPELAARGQEQCRGQKRVSGSVADLGVDQFVEVTLGTATTVATQSTFELTAVPGGTVDLIASLNTVDRSTDEGAVDRVIVRRGLSPGEGSILPVLDFEAPEAFAPAAADLTVANLVGDLAFVLSSFFTAGAPRGATIFLSSAEGSSPFRYYGIPSAHRVAGDLHLAAALVFSADEGEFRFAGLYFEDPIDRSVTLGASLPLPQVEVASPSPYLRLRASGSSTTAYDRYVIALFSQPGRSATIEASAAYRSQATYDLEIPDFTGVAGWLDEWGLREGVMPTNWFVQGSGFTGDGVSRPVPAEGVTFEIAERFGTLAP